MKKLLLTFGFVLLFSVSLFGQDVYETSSSEATVENVKEIPWPGIGEEPGNKLQFTSLEYIKEDSQSIKFEIKNDTDIDIRSFKVEILTWFKNTDGDIMFNIYLVDLPAGDSLLDTLEPGQSYTTTITFPVKDMELVAHKLFQIEYYGQGTSLGDTGSKNGNIFFPDFEDYYEDLEE
jgi:hypothetical protein